jgi:hypothetical protein
MAELAGKLNAWLKEHRTLGVVVRAKGRPAGSNVHAFLRAGGVNLQSIEGSHGTRHTHGSRFSLMAPARDPPPGFRELGPAGRPRAQVRRRRSQHREAGRLPGAALHPRAHGGRAALHRLLDVRQPKVRRPSHRHGRHGHRLLHLHGPGRAGAFKLPERSP